MDNACRSQDLLKSTVWYHRSSRQLFPRQLTWFNMKIWRIREVASLLSSYSLKHGVCLWKKTARGVLWQVSAVPRPGTLILCVAFVRCSSMSVCLVLPGKQPAWPGVIVATIETEETVGIHCCNSDNQCNCWDIVRAVGTKLIVGLRWPRVASQH
jgi:hypothetical protein